MRFRSTVLVALVALLLGGYVYLHEVRGGRNRAQKRAQAEKLLGVDAGQVTAIRIEHSGTQFVLEQHGGSWALARPVPAPCDPRVIGAFLDTLAAARREDEVGRGKLERYGLDAPAARLEIDAGGRTRKLALGIINPLQTLVYCQLDDDPQVLLTTSALLTYSLHNAVGWRDKRMIEVDPEQVERMSFKTLLAGAVEIRRDAQRTWRVDGPVKWRVDPVRARNLVESLARLEAADVAEENKVPIAKYGVDNRRFSAQLERADGSVAGDLVVGFADGKGAYFGIVPDKPEIFKVDGRTVDGWVDLVREPRDRKVFPPFLPDKVTRIQVRMPEDVFELRRRSAVDWIVASSQKVDSTYALAPGVVDKMLADMAALEVAAYPDRQPPASSYEPASIQLLLFDGQEQISGLEVGTKDPNGLFVFARAPGEPAVFLLSPAPLMQMPLDLEHLKADEQPAPVAADRG